MSRHHEEPGPEVTLPITPMLDMSFQLLFFFMVIFNPTDPEAAQTLAMARDSALIQPAGPGGGGEIRPGGEKRRNDGEPLEIDTDLRLVLEVPGRGKQPILLREGAIDLKKADSLADPELLKVLKKMVEDRKNKAREATRKAGLVEGMSGFETAVAAEFAKQKVRIQTMPDVPWGQAFDAVNLCARAGFKGVTLVSPKR
jgi:biopolymer transport protein ExbD